MLWKLFFGKSKEEYLQEVLDRLAGMDSQYSDLTEGMEDVRELLEASKVNGGLQEEKLNRLLTIMEEWMNTYEEKIHQLGSADGQELNRELESWSDLEKEYQQRIDLLQAQAEEYKQKHEESEKSVWSMQKEVQALKKKMNSMQNKQLHSISRKKSTSSRRQAIAGGQEISKEDQSLMKERYDYIPVSTSSKTTIFNPMRYSK